MTSVENDAWTRSSDYNYSSSVYMLRQAVLLTLQTSIQSGDCFGTKKTTTGDEVSIK